jgi:hypothetical protein
MTSAITGTAPPDRLSICPRARARLELSRAARRQVRISATIPHIAVLLQRLKYDALELRRQFRPQLRPPPRRVVKNGDKGQRHGVSVEGRSGGHHFIKHHAE